MEEFKLIDVKSAKAHLDKVKNYIIDIVSSDKTIYSKTLNQIVDIQRCCKEISDMITRDILEANSNSLSDDLTDIQRCMMILENMKSTQHSLDQLDECIGILHSWFSKRIVQLDPNTSSFRYRESQISSWIERIVIAYGNSVYDDTQTMFLSSFNTWCDSLSTKDIKYPLPYCVHEQATKVPAGNISLTSLVLWDMLWDNGFQKITKSSDSAIVIKSDMIYENCLKYNPYVLTIYSRYDEDSSVLIDSNLIKVGDSN